MKRRTVTWATTVGFAVLALGLGNACSSNRGGHSGDSEFGELKVSLTAEGASGTEYRLRGAVFEIEAQNDYNSNSVAGQPDQPVTTLRSEDDPAARSLSVSLEQGLYHVRLQPGWRLERLDGQGATYPEATLLSPASQWIYVSRNSSSFVAYQFGLGERSIWFNGELNVNVEIYESPGVGGASGSTGLGDAGGPF